MVEEDQVTLGSLSTSFLQQSLGMDSLDPAMISMKHSSM